MQQQSFIHSSMGSMTGEFDAEHIFGINFQDLLPPTPVENAALWNVENFPTFGDGATGFDSTPCNSDDTFSSMYGLPFGDQFNVPLPDMTHPVMNNFDITIAEFQSLQAQFQQESNLFSDQCNNFVTDFQPTCGGTDAWACQGNLLTSNEETSLKVRKYSVEERKDRIHRYLTKRNRRNFNKTIKYACRKALADRRIRVRGRFARNSELGEEHVTTKSNNNQQEQEEEYYDDNVEVKHINGEDWLQEAVSSLMYLPIFAG